MLFNFEGALVLIEREDEGIEKDGGVAQLGEHLPCKQGVMGSNPIISTIFRHIDVSMGGEIMQSPEGFEQGVKKTIRWIVFSPRENPVAKCMNVPLSEMGS